MMWGYFTDEPLDVDYILGKYSEESIFELIFSETPIIGKKYTSPFRSDVNAGCFFDYNKKGRLIFYDYADVHRDCFSAIQDYFNVGFREALALILNQTKAKKTTKNIVIPKSRRVIRYETKDYSELDKQYWLKYGITLEQLLQDKVYSILWFELDYIITPKSLCYVYTDFKSGAIKIYQPYGKHRFITNCSPNDIGGKATDDYLIITKSYKDYRVLVNYGYSSVWVQSESLFPKDLSGLSKFKYVIVFFDNDDAGFKGANTLVNKVKQYTITYSVHIDSIFGVKDISDFRFKYGNTKTKEFLEKLLNIDFI